MGRSLLMVRLLPTSALSLNTLFCLAVLLYVLAWALLVLYSGMLFGTGGGGGGPDDRAARRTRKEAFDSWFEDILEQWIPPWASPSLYQLEDLYVPSAGEEDGHTRHPCRVVILTSGDLRIDIDEPLRANRQLYAAQHGYCYKHLSCIRGSGQRWMNDNNETESESGGRDNEGDRRLCHSPHYWRYIALWKLMRSGTEWILYLDGDAMFTNLNRTVEDVTRNPAYASPSTALLVGTDADCQSPKFPLNNGVMLVRASTFAHMLAYHVLVRKDYHRALNHTDKWGARGLHDQPILIEVLAELRVINPEAIQAACSSGAIVNHTARGEVLHRGRHVTVLPGRLMNSFRRGNTYADMPELVWQPGDWIAHFTGTANKVRRYLLRETCHASHVAGHLAVCPFALSSLLTPDEAASVMETERVALSERQLRRAHSQRSMRIQRAAEQIRSNSDKLPGALDHLRHTIDRYVTRLLECADWSMGEGDEARGEEMLGYLEEVARQVWQNAFQLGTYTLKAAQHTAEQMVNIDQCGVPDGVEATTDLPLSADGSRPDESDASCQVTDAGQIALS
ncbi:unnamed protein product [Vitrella brassicaformis CCMP3155]|uniref:Nucleotide-diphospho-sugar transferase domain-containing protein n=2 Tax=Vitrella brassicaformis TaxID=1169539 RepID=A0A0G4EKP6_VITBC|nr:unnamed protein product [Vitrella brassicaformis CCMP3155]|eukprot:CEL97711.1 unnamed protein product [Vitrella brassicaformis CCMP3155]